MTYFARNEKQAEEFIKANFGYIDFSKNYDRYFSRNGCMVQVYEAECACGYCTGYLVFDELGNEEMRIKACEECHEDAPFFERLK